VELAQWRDTANCADPRTIRYCNKQPNRCAKTHLGSDAAPIVHEVPWRSLEHYFGWQKDARTSKGAFR